MTKTSPIRIAKKALLGTVLGDANLAIHPESSSANSDNAKLTLIQGARQLDYLLWKMQLLYPLVGDFNVKLLPSTSGNIVLHAVTKYKKCLKHAFKDFYIPGNELRHYKKIARLNVLRRLTPLSLAIWYMDDGCLYYDGSRIKGLRLGTYGFSKNENESICTYLKECWNIDSLVDVRLQQSNIYYCIRLRVDETKKFLDIVRDFIHPTFDYKLIPRHISAEHVPTREEIVCSLQKCGELVRNNQSNAYGSFNWTNLVKGELVNKAMRLRSIE